MRIVSTVVNKELNLEVLEFGSHTDARDLLEHLENKVDSYPVSMELTGCKYRFDTQREKMAFVLGFEACWDSFDEIMSSLEEDF